jgi:hypothetical protein
LSSKSTATLRFPGSVNFPTAPCFYPWHICTWCENACGAGYAWNPRAVSEWAVVDDL